MTCLYIERHCIQQFAFIFMSCGTSITECSANAAVLWPLFDSWGRDGRGKVETGVILELR